MRKNLRRGIYVIPTSFTVLNLFFGFRSIVWSIKGVEAVVQDRIDLSIPFFEHACWALFIAAVFDTFDGMVARKLGATSEFGKEYDSLADLLTFGAAPAVLIYCWGLRNLGGLGAGFAFLFLVAVSLRLARFNVMTGKTDYRYFVGLPSPAGALTIASIVNYAPTPIGAGDRNFAIVMLVVTAAVAFSMVSPIRWRSQKGINLQRQRSAMYFLMFAAVLAMAWMWTKEFFFIGAICYLTSGPLVRLWSIAFPSHASSPPAPPVHDEIHDELAPVEAP